MIVETLPDIPRTLTALAEWAACMVYIMLRRRRLPNWRFVALSAAALAALVGVHTVAERLPLELWTAGMAAAVATMLGFIVAATTIPVRDAGYFAARALVLAELVASLHWQMHCFFFLPAGRPGTAWQSVFFVVVYAVAFGGASLIEARHFRPAQLLDVSRTELASAVAIALVTFFMSNISFLTANTPFSGRLGAEIFYIRTLVDLCGFVALYAQQGQRLQHRARAEVRVIDGMLHRQHEQYLQSKRSMEIVHRKYHDLKHQIGVIRAETDPRRKASYLDDLEASLTGYAAQADTGDAVLDVILTARSLELSERGVSFTYVVDGAAVGFISAMDLAAVFGNALDNATEAAMAVPDPQERLVKVAVHARDGFVLMSFENYFTGELCTEGGEIVSRRPDRTRHGYGLKSIRYTAEKYGGSMTVNTEDGWFVLRILIPLPDAAPPRQADAEPAGRDQAAPGRTNS